MKRAGGRRGRLENARMKRAHARPASVRVAGGLAAAGEHIGWLPASMRRPASLGRATAKGCIE